MLPMERNLESINILRRAGLRSTPQRLAIVREVFSRHHPTVAEVYDALRREFPTIGLATVYNTLRTMTEKGLVHELPFVNATRFEVNLTPHANLVCTRCGEIEDSEVFEDGFLNEMRQRASAAAGFEPEGQRIDIYGLCRSCAEQTANKL